MSRTDSINILLENESKDKLAEAYGAVIENIQKNLISSQLKNTNLSGTPGAGSYEAKRFTNTESQSYGTARSANAGDAVEVRPVTVNIDQKKELVNEVEQSDVTLYGVADLINRKAASNQKAMQRELEKAFFAEAVNAGTSHTFTASAIQDKAEELIQLVETVSNDFVDGVERDMIALVLTPALYGQLRTYFDAVNHDAATEGAAMFHGVKVFSSVYMPSGTDAIVMAQGAIAQPVLPSVAQPERIQLSNAIGFGIFYFYGTEAVMPDLVFYVGGGSTGETGVTGA